ncbi:MULTISPECIES: NAD(P)/FAD-dependent oxidoreductase [Rhodococcus]|uniref:NAD(P)/FAD-dependent oxidoreductase n=1 Tax=Rhodococcus oxybenzonivorans TaxID=1990687 RepID=A0AAE4V110_9NOCA|nr:MULTISPECIES: NAD(P)/FAD-dependent oxidoreductase [Rhodococcus]MDV7240562.1 NAD(P)/FAD-dependent oxidoreductase [Rhodococcus oxybenzonivorans]MDV7265743.1 NAD(P)/FAD-dependent oxidoreductase [Rhodococcus oxybenzonivorans]MDV7272835.1 NAD(P)/FAD-dependent oxidoreductase [Rhodococcus oxybenzonivorans]MDV7333426.1 NAD(P)/FAD-dependent oxidoreductase [Rhodococcus oxybenzonivorans]MDV7342593.1 NAD(P)/FAD-dependent oxidoreductase [Rhodococcus oxybenzonivorans]
MLRTKPSRRRQPSVAIIGAGFGGIGAAVKLKEAGFSRITILERADGPGGTWWHNSYPGAEVDTPSVLYSFSWMPWNWTRTHVRQSELQEYLEAVIDTYDLAEDMCFGTTVDRVVWDEYRQEYAVWSDDRILLRATHVISAVGLLGDPKIPDWEGLEDFQGPVFHAAQWNHDIDLTGRRVAVVGSGSTAAQLVPALADIAGEVLTFQREPGWIVPKHSREYTPTERWALNSSFAQRFLRTKFVLLRERDQIGGALWREGTAVNTAARLGALAHIDRVLGDRPDLVEAVTPTHPFAGKRPVISDGFYPALLKQNVKLVPRAVKGIVRTGLIDSDGEQHDVDAIVFATGFKADFLTTYDVIGRNGISLHDLWRGEETAFLGIMAKDVPNFFMLYGPNTNGGTIVTNLELQVKYVVSAIEAAHRRRASAVEIRPLAQDLYDRAIQRRLEGTTFHFENNYYRSKSGRISTQWPEGVIVYAILTKLLRWPLWRFSFRLGRSNDNRPPQMQPEPFEKLRTQTRVEVVQ